MLQILGSSGHCFASEVSWVKPASRFMFIKSKNVSNSCTPLLETCVLWPLLVNMHWWDWKFLTYTGRICL